MLGGIWESNDIHRIFLILSMKKEHINILEKTMVIAGLQIEAWLETFEGGIESGYITEKN